MFLGTILNTTNFIINIKFFDNLSVSIIRLRYHGALSNLRNYFIQCACTFKCVFQKNKKVRKIKLFQKFNLKFNEQMKTNPINQKQLYCFVVETHLANRACTIKISWLVRT